MTPPGGRLARRRLPLVAGVLGLSTLLAGPPADAASTFVDDSGQSVSLPAPARRIVSLAPSATEMLFAAGAGAQVIGTTEFADEPPAARRIPRLGDSAAVDLERVLVLRPDVIVLWPAGTGEAQVQRIASLHLPIYRQQVHVLADLPGSLRRLGELAGTQAAAEAAAHALEERLARLRARYAGRRSVTVLLQVWNHPVYTVGGTQLMSDVLEVCGAHNVFADLTDPGPAVSIESVIARDPEAIVSTAPGKDAAGWLNDWRKLPGLRAVRTGNLVAFEDQRLSRLGPSVLGAADSLCELIDAARARIRPR
jgi:iron complex transport system substrate-binding protein